MSAWLKEKEIAAQFRVSVKTIRRWAQRGMPRVHEGNVVLYLADDCETWLRGRTQARPLEPSAGTAAVPRRSGRPRRFVL